ncbi:MAG: hypothetical protein H8E31_14700 [Planctomycetes bacterium]|nr:hypothetical protein [Planctomycetota bacterium]
MPRYPTFLWPCLAGLTLSAALSAQDPGAAGGSPRFQVELPAGAADRALDGRLLLMLSKNDEAEPRFQIVDGAGTQQVFGVDVEGWEPGTTRVVDAAAFGYPLESLAQVPAGEYFAQALLHRYETFHRADGHVVKLPMDRGEGQQWNRAPGNLLSTPVSVTIEPASRAPIRLRLDRELPPIPQPPDTKYVRHFKIRSELLSAFWGRDMELGAVVLLPRGFDEHPEARYPLIVEHGHFPLSFGEFRESPPDPGLVPDYSARFRLHGYNRIQQEAAHELFQDWTGPDFPRWLVI